ELGWRRPRAPARNDSAQSLRSALRRARSELDLPQEERARRGPRGSGEPGAVARPAASASARRTPHVGARGRAGDREPAVRLREEDQGTRRRRPPDRLTAELQDPLPTRRARTPV